MTFGEVTTVGQQGFARSIQTGDGLFTVNQERRITYWSETATQILGYEADETVGKRCYEVLCKPGTPGRESCNSDCRAVANARRGRPVKDFDLACKASDGTNRWLNVSVMFERPFQKDAEIVHLFRDVTERRSIEHATKPDKDLYADETSAPGIRETTTGSVRVTLSPREDQVLRLLSAGKSTEEIASILNIKAVSARNHITRVMSKLGATTRLQAVITGIRNGLV